MEKWGLKELQSHLRYLEKLELDRIRMLSDETKFEINLKLDNNKKRKKVLTRKEKNTIIEYLLSIYTKKNELVNSQIVLGFIMDLKKFYENHLSEYKVDYDLIEYYEKTLKWLMVQYFHLLQEKDKSVN